ncbi:hypothetical protein EYC80_001328 [Monilinia laxa]|uniref:Bulb-type lectin domain-containing protein n=1 Tax=Monilinia laxa TaxID=61186 RepID=A0A5N6K8W5_MONLA|nr:hypothetical protein EYC80_001328 [Monilinia laxa]
MRSLFYSAGLLFNVILSSTSATLLAKPSAPSLPLTVTELRSFGDKIGAENLAVRSNGQLLVTRLDTPILQLLDPTNKTAPITLHSFNATTYIGRDFVIREDGTIFICGNGQDTLFVWKKGLSAAVAVLWLTTSDAQAQPINGTTTTGATVPYVYTERI